MLHFNRGGQRNKRQTAVAVAGFFVLSLHLRGEKMYVNYNPSPKNRRVGDCVIRALSKATGQDWDTTYVGICAKGYELCDMPSSNYVWGEYLRAHGFRRELVPDGLTVAEFAERYKHGTYVLAISGHVVCVKDGSYYDTWDSGDEVPIYAWVKNSG